MKTWTKRTIAVCLLLALFLTAIPCASAKQYTDVTRSALPDYFDAINYVTDNGIMNGVSTSSFSPNEMVTRAMFITTLYRYAGSPSSFAAVSFTDISSSHYAYNAVKWGVKYNIVTGTTTTTFSPDEQVTREQAMTFLWRYLKNYVGGTPYYMAPFPAAETIRLFMTMLGHQCTGRSAMRLFLQAALPSCSIPRPGSIARSLPSGSHVTAVMSTEFGLGRIISSF